MPCTLGRLIMFEKYLQTSSACSKKFCIPAKHALKLGLLLASRGKWGSTGRRNGTLVQVSTSNRIASALHDDHNSLSSQSGGTPTTKSPVCSGQMTETTTSSVSQAVLSLLSSNSNLDVGMSGSVLGHCQEEPRGREPSFMVVMLLIAIMQLFLLRRGTRGWGPHLRRGSLLEEDGFSYLSPYPDSSHCKQLSRLAQSLRTQLQPGQS